MYDSARCRLIESALELGRRESGWDDEDDWDRYEVEMDEEVVDEPILTASADGAVQCTDDPRYAPSAETCQDPERARAQVRHMTELFIR